MVKNSTHPWGIEGVRGSTPEDPLWYWMSERRAIWERRNSGQPKPWTSDQIFQRFRFCNVFRELDKVTIWIADHIRRPFANHQHLWFMLAIARTINQPDTLAELIRGRGTWPNDREFSPEKLGTALQARMDRGDVVYTGAYMIRAESDRSKPWFSWSKQRYIAEVVLGRLWEQREYLSGQLAQVKRLEQAWRLLAEDPRYVGWGPFMTYEWVTDLRWTRYLRDAWDRNTWANAGPGALRGLRRLTTGDGTLGGPIAQRAALPRMIELLNMAKKNLPPGFGELELRDIEHSLCETDKYLRVYHNEGKPRAAYNGLP